MVLQRIDKTSSPIFIVPSSTNGVKPPHLFYDLVFHLYLKFGRLILSSNASYVPTFLNDISVDATSNYSQSELKNV